MRFRVGSETVNYVSNIYRYYVAYQLIVLQKERSDKTRESLRNTAPWWQGSENGPFHACHKRED